MNKKYTIYDNENDNMVFETNDNDILNMEIIVNYPLGDYISIRNKNDSFIFTFENYTVVIKK